MKIGVAIAEYAYEHGLARNERPADLEAAGGLAMPTALRLAEAGEGVPAFDLGPAASGRGPPTGGDPSHRKVDIDDGIPLAPGGSHPGRPGL